jgi:hypothetical protein
MSEQVPLESVFVYKKSCHQSIYICRAEIDNCHAVRILLSLRGGIKFKMRFALLTYGLPCFGKGFSDAQDLVRSVLY